MNMSVTFQVRWAKCLAPFQTLNQCDQILLLQVTMMMILIIMKAKMMNMMMIVIMIIIHLSRSAGRIFSFSTSVNGVWLGISVTSLLTGHSDDDDDDDDVVDEVDFEHDQDHVYCRGAQAGLSPGTDREVRTILEIMARCSSIIVTTIVISVIVVIIVINFKSNS